MRAIFLIMIIGLSSLVYADFSKSPQGVVTDSNTNLQWQDDYSDNNGDVTQKSWEEAIKYCETLQLDGGKWRLPNQREVLSIVDYSADSPSISSVFTKTNNNAFWTSTTAAHNEYDAWDVSFYHGNSSLSNKPNVLHVRCVRGGQ